MDYEIVSALHLPALAIAVRSRLSDGWEPIGSPVHDADSRNWCQAMIREKKADPENLKLREKKK